MCKFFGCPVITAFNLIAVVSFILGNSDKGEFMDVQKQTSMEVMFVQYVFSVQGKLT